ncbi:DUF2969 family protein [Liquorilactobacillus satsumensis]|uniref:DUF2969 family protein n=1 Tax=Liquorilactobacillus satsumensis TaxID=259059 RepID=UPI001E4A6006|nr:DUF2969 family protein [Liquorilactobacillus satsumensis]MCC7667323.1 hypothetical protein [Liquorilactobacillus satsumensis]MCP9357079.1 DUF2969 family protein [Liquorilactobacillus satsumensis]MCP9371026.1 DUF2969 family protein [Liquorilactobacillus satsumensis]
MSKREKNIEIVEEEKEVNGTPETNLKIGTVSVGSVKQDGQKFIAVFPNGETFRTGSHKEAVNLLIREYHLHRN